MKIIKITTDNMISVHPYPIANSSTEENQALYELVENCNMLEHVMPMRLYTECGGSNRVSEIEGSCVSMLVDEEGLFKNCDINVVASYLYEMDRHGNPIVGNILIIGEKWEAGGTSFCGISEEQFHIIYPKLKHIVERAGVHI